MRGRFRTFKPATVSNIMSKHLTQPETLTNKVMTNRVTKSMPKTNIIGDLKFIDCYHLESRASVPSASLSINLIAFIYQLIE